MRVRVQWLINATGELLKLTDKSFSVILVRRCLAGHPPPLRGRTMRKSFPAVRRDAIGNTVRFPVLEEKGFIAR